MASNDNTEPQSFRRNNIFGKKNSSRSTVETMHIRIVPSIENPSRSLIFNIIERDLEMGRIIKIGRFTDRSSIQNHISFKSKVVSRSHCEIWLSNDGKVLLKDTRSSSGTFVNHVRLSTANTESRPVEIRDGDLVQLGVDYQGGYEEIYRSVKMRFEVNRPVQPKPVTYSVSVLNNLRNLTSLPVVKKDVQLEECCICLYALAPFQALFVAPCSHSYHFKCIRPLFDSYPGFQCPICRTYSDLDASVALEAEEVIEKYGLRTKPVEQPHHSILPITPEPPLSTTLVACTTSLSGIISSPIEQDGDHRATIIMDDDNVIPRSNNLVDKIKMAFSNDKKKRNEDIIEQQLYESSSSPLSRQSTHYNPLNDILEESMISNR